MKVNAEKLEKSRVSLEIECSPEVADEALRNACSKIARKVTIPGFRRGKAPKSLVKRYYGADVLDEAIEDALPREYLKAVEQTGIEPVDHPEFSDVHFLEGKPVRFKAVVTVKPEVKLEGYDSISVPFEHPEVSDEDVDRQIDMIKENMAQLEPLEEDRPLKVGEYVTCRVKSVAPESPTGGDVSPEDTAPESYSEYDKEFEYLEVGREQVLLPALGKTLEGMKKGEKKEFASAFSSHEESKVFQFEVEVKEAYEKKLPKDLDEVAKNAGKESGEELRSEIKAQLMEMRMRMAWDKYLEKVEEEILEHSECLIPDVMVGARFQDLLESFQKRLDDAKLNLADYLTSTKSSWEDFVAHLNKEAEKAVKRELVLDAFSELENIEVPEERLDKVVDELAKEMGQDPKAVKTTLELRGALEDIKAQLRRIEALNFAAGKASANAGTPLPEMRETQTDAQVPSGQEPGEVSEPEQAETTV